jgi:hypothetical protein
MRKIELIIGLVMAAGIIFTSCGGGKEKETAINTLSDEEKTEGWQLLFDGSSFAGWRGYNKDSIPGAWKIDSGAMKIMGSGRGEAGSNNGGDIIFDKKFKNFTLKLEWKVAKGSNSGIFYLAQEVKDKPIYYSAPECQVLDNKNHPDAQLGIDGNRQSSSLYDMIAAKPQNSKPYGEWNQIEITVFKGTVIHKQNGEVVVEYHLWTPEWKDMLDKSKFRKDGDHADAYELLLNCGGENHEGFVGLQDHGDDVWFRNIKIKNMD